MKKFRLACVLSLALSPIAQAATIYVSNTSTNGCSLPTTGCGGYFNPFKNLREAIDSAVAGDEIVVWGTAANVPYYYYNQGVPPQNYTSQGVLKSDIGQSLMTIGKFNSPTLTTTIRTQSNSPYKPVIRGTLVYRNWTLDSSNSNGYLYKVSWTLTQYGQPVPQEPQVVFRDSLPDGQRQLKQVGGKVFGDYDPSATPRTANADLLAGESGVVGGLWLGYIPFPGLTSLPKNHFYYDRVAKVLYVRLETQLAANEGIEVGAVQFIANGSGMKNVTFQNLVFERSNTSTYWRGGAVLTGGNNLTFDSVDFRESDSHCLQVEGNNNKVQNSTFKRCGQVGLVANGSSNLIKNNYFTENNNFRRFNSDWEAGPTKFIGQSGLNYSEISDNVVTSNNGYGIWLDTDNTGNTIKNNVSAYNRIGIALENSVGNTVQDNVVFGNRSQAINLRGATNTLVKNNLLVGNYQDGIFVHASSAANYASAGLRILGNTIAWHDEGPGNKKPVWVPPSATLFDNRYCGTPTGTGSLHFWLQDWAPDPSLGYANNVFTWSTWRAAKVSPTNPTAPAYDNDSTVHADNDPARTGVMQLSTVVPPAVAAWQNTHNLALTGYPNGIANSRSAVLAYVTSNCQ